MAEAIDSPLSFFFPDGRDTSLNDRGVRQSGTIRNQESQEGQNLTFLTPLYARGKNFLFCLSLYA